MHRHRRDDASPRRGFLTVLVAQLIPVVPFTVVNYLAGATALRLRLFLSATALGIVPATTAHVALGAYGSRAPLVAVLDRPHRAGSAHCRCCAGRALPVVRWSGWRTGGRNGGRWRCGGQTLRDDAAAT